MRGDPRGGLSPRACSPPVALRPRDRLLPNGERRVPYATNPSDDVRTYFEDMGDDKPPILVYPGFTDSIEYAKRLPVVDGLSEEFRLVFADHRGQGRSDKPGDVAAYALPTRVADVVAVLDALELDTAHFFGSSWGARLGFAVGEH